MPEILTPTAAPIDLVEIRALVQNASEDDYAFESDDQRAHVHARRIGPAKGGLSARVAITAHDPRSIVGGVYTAAEARMIAARLLDLADEIDGKTPLVFMPACPSGEHETPHPTEGLS